MKEILADITFGPKYDTLLIRQRGGKSLLVQLTSGSAQHQKWRIC